MKKNSSSLYSFQFSLKSSPVTRWQQMEKGVACVLTNNNSLYIDYILQFKAFSSTNSSFGIIL